MGAAAERLLIRKPIKSTKQEGYATYDKQGRQNTSGNPMVRPVYPVGGGNGFSG